MKIFQKSFMLMKATKQLTTNLIAIFLIGTVFSFAQEDNAIGPLTTDRPDQTESPSPMPKGFIQIETGAFFESFKDNALKTEDFTYNSMLLRYGLLDNLELRLGYDYTNSKTKFNGQETASINSFSPLLLGFKVGIAKENGALPEIGFLGHLNLPFSVKKEFRPQYTGVDFRFSFEHTLSEKSSLAYNLGAAWENDSPQAAYLYTLAYGYSITNKTGVYIELYGDFPERDKANHLWNTGLTYLVSNNFQLDASVGTSITKGQDLFISAGLSYRIPKSHN